MLKVNLLAVAAVFLVLVLTLRSLFLPVILVLGIETAIWLNLSIPYFMNQEIFYLAYLIISSIQLGATVDYAILLTNRYRENRQTFDKHQAVVHTVSDVTVSILTSGLHFPQQWNRFQRCKSTRISGQHGDMVRGRALFFRNR